MFLASLPTVCQPAISPEIRASDDRVTVSDDLEVWQVAHCLLDQVREMSFVSRDAGDIADRAGEIDSIRGQVQHSSSLARGRSCAMGGA